MFHEKDLLVQSIPDPDSAITSSNEQAEIGFVELARHGDTEAFSRLMELYWTPLYSYLARLTTNEPEITADLTQETFFRAYRSITRLPGESLLQFRPWLYKIATNLARTHSARNRKKKGRFSLSLEQLLKTPPSSELSEWLRDHTAGPLEMSLSTEESREIVKTLGGLPQEQAALLLLRFHLEMNSQEISQVLKIKPEAVRARLHRARLAFARAYARLEQE